MATKIRLQRHGRKGYAFYQIVVADSRAPRDGKFIERLGSYNPNTDPSTIDLNFDRALHWLRIGAQPTDTARMILSREGVCLKKHLLEGVGKGAFDESVAEEKFRAWLESKRQSLQSVRDKNRESERSTLKSRLESERAINKAKADELAAKKAAVAAAKAAELAAARAAQEEAAAKEAAELAPPADAAPEKPAEAIAETPAEAPTAITETPAE